MPGVNCSNCIVGDEGPGLLLSCHKPYHQGIHVLLVILFTVYLTVFAQVSERLER